MSKNIEVLLRAKETIDLFRPKSVAPKSSEAKPSAIPIDPISRAEEAELVQRVFLLPAYEVPRVVVFCGVGKTDGAGGICARAGQNLAHQTGSSVCVVEGDFHSASLHQYFDVANSPGLTDALLESGPIQHFVHSVPKSNLSVLPVGSRSGDGEALWKSERLQSRIAELRREFSYVLVYCPLASQHVGGMLLGQIADGAILILESMVTRRETARATKESLEAAKVKILGAVLNNHTFAIPETVYRRL
jgi:succinoglycan biosynthesis transport protein ExoP